MGKKQHSKDRLYLTTKEWKEEWGGKKTAKPLPFSRLPFHCCSITFSPFDDPVCAPDGSVFDIVNVVPYLQKYHCHPVSGEPLEVKDLIQLNFHKNADNEFHCPVLNKVFTEHSHIVAVKPTGNVYCYEAISELNVKPKCWRDLLTDKPFTRKDIIHIQDPLNFQKKVIEEFEHIKNHLNVEEAPEEDGSCLRHVSEDTQRVLDTLGTSSAKAAFESGGGGKAVEARRILAAAQSQDATNKEENTKLEARALDKRNRPENWILQAPKRDRVVKFKPGANTWDTDDYINPEEESNKRKRSRKSLQETIANPTSFDPNGNKPNPKQGYEPNVKYESSVETTGGMSRSFTSTVMNPQTKSERVMVRVNLHPTKKAYIKLHTNLGDMNLELECSIAPRACENFIGLCEMGYYNGVAFHRSIRNFMIQGGDPTGTGQGGESIYGPTFKDELDNRLTHSGRGVLSMANSGPHTNGSQFFIMYKSARHLDLKHSVFGKVVGGLETLAAMERVKTDDEDRPVEEIRIEGATVYVNPYEEMRQAEKVAEMHKEEDEVEDNMGLWFTDPANSSRSKTNPQGENGRIVGKYLKIPIRPNLDLDTLGSSALGKKTNSNHQGSSASKKNAVYGNFDAW